MERWELPSSDRAGRPRLAQLMAELELRLGGDPPGPSLAPDLAAEIPEAATYVLVLFDGLGVAQLDHPGAGGLAGTQRETLDAPFPTTTSVALSTVATGLEPARHGVVAHLMWVPELGQVVNTLKWVTVPGEAVAYDYGSLLPRPNLWERLQSKGVEPITVQPGDFTGSPLSQALYRGARFEGAWDIADLVTATLQLAAAPGRLIFTYVPHVDFAGHVYGLDSEEFTEAIGVAEGIWEGLARSLPPGAALLGTADHGLMQVDEADKQLIRDPRFDELRFAGDPRGVHLWGDPGLIGELAEQTEGALADPSDLFGPDVGPAARSRLGERLLLAPENRALLPKGFDKRLRCYHGGLTRAEVEVPLLLG